ncbi:tetratricopeptide repeat protein [Alkalilimnicola ehrlichii]|uniref:tetratricopeptide repeat protein n=1 Tax=Alkalilimnicola ehrlichii TaxID=351052 RepID=UPI0015F29445|nr:tetratricopeptide repeat protein [Alkalilimnicola ehrlichii]
MNGGYAAKLTGAVRATGRSMQRRAIRVGLALAVAVMPVALVAQEGGDEGNSIGTVDFGVDCQEAVQEDFDRALALLHHMMYSEAQEAFASIAEADPNCGMAYWGVASTLFQPLWPTRPSEAELEQGLSAVETAEGLVQDERERNLVAATKAFFEHPEDDDYWARLERWADGMENAYQANPDDLDTAALYGLALVTVAPRADDRHALHDEAEAILRAVFEEEPTHPGAIHYSIHSTDVDGRAENALDMVEVYGAIAPNVAHALHMPSHIYVRLGDWPEVIDWNRRSADAALREPVDGAASHHYIHALDYLLYAYLQRGEDAQAWMLFEEVLAVERHQPTFISAFHAAAMPARFTVERRRWEEAAMLPPRTPEYLPWEEAQWAEGLTWYARGLGGVHIGDIDRAEEAAQRLEALRDDALAAGEEGFATYIEIDRRILAGWLARTAGRYEEAVASMRSAVELEASVEKDPTTPGALLPPNEALGDLLMDLGRPNEALEAYRAAEEVWPGRYNTLLGAARAAVAVGDEEAARTYYRGLLEIAPESTRLGANEARAFLER